MKLQEFIITTYHLLWEPVCEVQLAWELPVQYWILTLMLLYDLARGSIRGFPDFVWILVHLVIVTRLELLFLTLVLPFLVGKSATWCKSQEYMYTVVTFFARVSYVFMNLGMKVHHISPECARALRASFSREKAVFN